MSDLSKTIAAGQRRGVARKGLAPAHDVLLEIPGIGPSLARDLHDLGFHAPADLRHANPEKMYADLCELRGEHQDRCVLYTFRCAVYYAGTTSPDPALLQWWNWKDRTR